MHDLISKSPQTIHQSDFFVLGIIGAILLASFTAVEGYSKGNSLIFKSILFGLIEYEENL